MTRDKLEKSDLLQQDSWELRPLNEVHVANILHTANTRMSMGGLFAMTYERVDESIANV